MDLPLPTERNVDTWQVYLWNLPEDVLSRAQKLQFMLMLEGEFNAFDPYLVVGDLLQHRDGWRGAVMDRGYLHPDDATQPPAHLRTDLIKLRDIQAHWNVDTLFILTDPSNTDRLQALAENWVADEIGVVEEPAVSALLGAYGGHSSQIVTVWWD